MPRFRVFAGPNGSGKSTIIKAVREHKINGNSIDFGVYVNADDIAVALKNDKFSFAGYELAHITSHQFQTIILGSGLINEGFPFDEFTASYEMRKGSLYLSDSRYTERVAQILANFMVKQLLDEGKKCSLETVFSHSSKMDIMKIATGKGYKVYLYFVATDSPEINVARVRSRVRNGGHDVPVDRIVARYYRSLGMLYDAAQLAYQCYFFDNSESEHKLVAHFKEADGVKAWDAHNSDALPDWFIKYYVNKQ